MTKGSDNLEQIPFSDKLKQSLEMVTRMYLDESDTRDWAVAWSGGKDSTTVLSIITKVIEYLPSEHRKRHVYAVMSDTKVENPELGAYMHDQVREFNRYVQRKDLPMSAQIVARPPEKSYFVLTLGRGYFLPQNNGTGRWCTGRLKLEPQNEALKAIDPSFILIGTRTAESASRAESIRKWTISERIGEHANLSNTNTFMVIVDWTADDVWEYLGTVNLGWTSTTDVRRLYKEATGECGINNPKGVELKASQMEACGARFGCWLCPVITTDRSTESMTKYHEWLEPLTDYRQMQSKIYGAYKPMKPEGQSRADRSEALRKWEAINEKVMLITKSGYNRQGKRMKDGQGTFTLEARKFLFDELMATQLMVNRLRALSGLPALELITQEEIDIIHALWAEDERVYPHVLTNSLGIPISELEPLLDGKIAQEDIEAYKARREANKKPRKGK